MNRAYNFEKAIAEYIMTQEATKLPENIAAQNNPVTYDELRSMSPVFPIADMLLSVDLSSDRVNLMQPKWLEGINTLYTAANLEDMKAYQRTARKPLASAMGMNGHFSIILL